VYRNGVPITSVSGTTFTDGGVSQDQQYDYAVQAFDTIGNLSPKSASVGVHTTATIDPASGVPVEWEQLYFGQTGLDPNAPSGNGDSFTILQEFLLGRDPRDFYNGVAPTHQLLNDGTEGPSGELALIVLRPDGTPWANAPVTFTVQAGHRRISATPDGAAYDDVVQVRADANGLAQVYLEPIAQ
jgi:hypothetical protein